METGRIALAFGADRRSAARRLLLASSLLAALALASLPGANAQDFQGLGFPPGHNSSGATAVSADGLSVVGAIASNPGGLAQASRWTAPTGNVGLGFAPGGSVTSIASGVNADGSVVVGFDNGVGAFRWTAATGLVAINAGAGNTFTSATAVNADGSVVVGWGETPTGSGAVRWTAAAGITLLGSLPPYLVSFSRGVNASGTVVIGEAVGNPAVFPQGEAFRWTAATGMTGLGYVPGFSMRSTANGVNADGTVVVGVSYGSSTNSAFRWTAATGMVGIGGDVANGVSADGNMIVGIDSNGRAFRWTPAIGIQSIQDTLIANSGNFGWTLTEANDVSADGTVIVGRGINPSGSPEAWLARIPLNAFALIDLAGMDRSIGSLVWGGTVTNSGPGPATFTAGSDNSDSTFKGSIQDGTSQSAFTKVGSGTLSLTGTSTHTGGTTISGGTLQLGDGGTTGSIPGDVVNNANFAINRSDAFTFGGLISGTGAFQQNGTGTTNLTATNTYTGATTVNAGTLLVNGSIAPSGSVTVNAGATLGGNGTVPSVVLNNGATLSPGNSIGTLTVAGNLTFNTGSTYLVEVSPAAADRVNVSGTANLGGTLRAVFTPSAYASNSYTILAAGARNGTFDAFNTHGLPSFLSASLRYTATDVLLVTLVSNVQFLGNTPNQRAVAGAIDTAFNSGKGLFPGFAALNQSQIPAALDALSGEVHASTAGVLVDESRYVRNAMLGRLRQASYGGGMTALSLGGPQLAFADSTLAYGKSPIVTKAPRVAPGPDQVFWAQGFGARGTFDGDGNAAGVTRDLASFITGFDARFGGGRAGIAAGYTSSRNNLDGRGSANVDTGHVAAYGGMSVGALNLRGGGAYAFHSIDTDRTIAFPGFADRATAHYKGGTGQIFGEAGYGFAFGSVAVEPFAGAAWVHLNTDATNERGGAAALALAANTFEVGYSMLGIRAATVIPVGHDMVLVPRASAAWQHAFSDVTPSATLAFQNTGAAFTVGGVPIARDALLTEAGLDLAIGRNATIGLSYVGQFARNAEDHAAKGKFSWRF